MSLKNVARKTFGWKRCGLGLTVSFGTFVCLFFCKYKVQEGTRALVPISGSGSKPVPTYKPLSGILHLQLLTR